MEKLWTAEIDLDRFLDLVKNGHDAVWQSDDPFPFLALNFLQIPALLIQALILGTQWNKVNFCLGQVL